MDATRFTNNATGRLYPISEPKKDWAFIPNRMPINWEFDQRLWPLLVDAKEALGTLNGIGQTLPDPHLLLRPLQSREAITSSKIEGTIVTPEQLLLFGLDPREPKTADDQKSDWLEVFNYGRALERGCEMLNELPICNRIILEIHGILMRGVRGLSKNPGEFRKWQVQIGSIGRFIPSPANEIEGLMDNLEKYINTTNQYDPLVRAYIIHYQFEAIHPFGDGNGRVGRALLALMIYKWLGHTMPWLYMSAFFERYRDEYIDYLFKISTNGDWTKWIEFCLHGTIAQARDSIRRCHQFNCVRTEFLERRMKSHSKRTYAIIEGLFKTPVLNVTEVAERFQIRYASAKSDIQRLVDAQIVEEFKDVHPRTFYSPEIMKIAFGEPETLTVQSTIPISASNEQEQPVAQSPYVYSEVALPPSLDHP